MSELGHSLPARFVPRRPDVDAQMSGMMAAAQSVGRRLVILKAGTELQIDAAFEQQGAQKFDALLECSIDLQFGACL